MKGCKLLVIKALRPGPHCCNLLLDDTFLKSRSYAEILAFLREQCLLYPNDFCQSMNEFGYECSEVVFDFLPLQTKWCEERGKKFPAENWQIEILKNQISEIRPDIIYFERTLFGLPISFRLSLRKQFPFIKLLSGYWGAQTSDPNWIKELQQLDVVFCIDTVLQRAFQAVGINAVITSHCFDQSAIIFDRTKHHEAVFLGVSGYGFSDHSRRFQELKFLLEHTPIEMWCWEYPPLTPLEERIQAMAKVFSHFPLPVLSFFQTNRIIKSNNFREILRQAQIIKKAPKAPPWYANETPLGKTYPTRVHPVLLGMDYLKKIASAKVVFNSHVDHPDHFGNLRTYETTGIGSCLVTDRAKQMKDLFKEDEEIVGYSSIEEAKEKIKYLLEHEKKREAIAAKGRARTLKDHSTKNRCKIINNAFSSFKI